MSQSESVHKRHASELEDGLCDVPTSKKLCTSSGEEPPVESEPVAIIVGEEKEKFSVHAHLLEGSSEYFLKVLSVSQDGDQMCTVKLEDADASAFSIYAKWPYTGRFHLATSPDTQTPNGSPNDMCWDEMSACYALSDFSDATIDAFTRRMEIRNNSPVELAKWIYPKTTKDSAHRRLCRDIIVHTWARKKWDRLWTEDYPPELVANVLADVSVKFARGSKRRELTEFLEAKNACEYYEHKRLELPCYKARFGI
ncbi:hypothetical protein CC86DRAFT_445065 [Ophiobolus disseminans]|uniref:BTB domain-containing protein n=1 Tax=Ophiobolus disseminans TaxID=1469910 RepID=A0A6A7A4D0_9PLEO|nr:hypothetical protein CC86DRAFT_445065 [Ophiobolus disseminans]